MTPEFTVSQAIAVFNQILETTTPSVIVVGEVANSKVNQGKWVFFDIKDDAGTLNCFMVRYQLRMELADGMKVKLLARPNITKWGKFSLTVQSIKPIGEGSIKKSFELLKKKLTGEGLFDEKRKRPLPRFPQHIGVISSVDAAGYRDFIKIVSARQGGLTIDVISTQVQGDAAPDQIIAAIHQFNEMVNPPDVLAILRGGGSRDDLVTFDDEKLVRAVAASRIPVISGVGHEIDTTLIDLAADKRASTPSNAAELLVMDKREIIATVNDKLATAVYTLENQSQRQRTELINLAGRLGRAAERAFDQTASRAQLMLHALRAYDPRAALTRGYAMVWTEQHRALRLARAGERLTIETQKQLIDTEVKNVRQK